MKQNPFLVAGIVGVIAFGLGYYSKWSASNEKAAPQKPNKPDVFDTLNLTPVKDDIPAEYLNALKFCENFKKAKACFQPYEPLMALKRFDLTERFSSEIAACVDTNELITKLELMLRQSKILIESSNVDATLTLNMDAVSNACGLHYVTTISVNAWHFRPLTTNWVSYLSPCWSTLHFGTTGTPEYAEPLRQSETSAIEYFLNDYLKANPSQ